MTFEHQTSTDPIYNITIGGDFSGRLETTGTDLRFFSAGGFNPSIPVTGNAPILVDGDIGRFVVGASTTSMSGAIEADDLDPTLFTPDGILLNDDNAVDIRLVTGLAPSEISINGNYSGKIVIDGDLTDGSLIDIFGRLENDARIDVNGQMLDGSEIVVGTGTGVALEDGAAIDVFTQVRDGAKITIEGDLNGGIRLQDLEGRVDVTDDVGGTGEICLQTLSTTGRIEITDDLVGQIIINENNNNDEGTGP